MIGTQLGPYRIVAPLGAGGMGEVYRARDERLGRDVAVKVLPATVADDPERLARFEREARALAALSHPNILSIFDFGKEAGTTYAVTELLEGETLRQRIIRERPPWRKTVEIAAAIADGLAAAHGKGIIHRDLKPENVFLTADGRVKVLDFGLARLEKTSPAGEGLTTWTDPGTVAGTVLGTVGYMAPEQVRGLAADARSDIFALGCLVYEMLAGKRAFARETAAETMTAILKDPAPEVSVSGVEVMPELNRIIGHCLEKNPGERFQSASDLAFHLKTLLTGTVTVRSGAGGMEPAVKPETPSIAVLPFANLSPDPDQEYFCDGMMEEIITALSKIRGLRVISRNSAMTLKGTPKTTREIAELLHVGHVLEGSVRKSGNNLRITAQLIDAATDAHLWAERYAGTLDDVFDIQEKVACSIAKALSVKLSADEMRRLGRHPLNNLDAYDCYLKALSLLSVANDETLRRALDLLDRGLERVGDNDLLYACKAFMQIQFVNTLSRPPDTFGNLVAQAQEWASRALELNPECALAHLAQGHILAQAGNPRGCAHHCRRALELEPSNAVVSHLIGYLLAASGFDLDSAAKHAARAVDLDPLLSCLGASLGFVDLFRGNFAGGVKHLSLWLDAKEAVKSPFAVFLTWAHALNRDWTRAYGVLERIRLNLPGHIMARFAAFLEHSWRRQGENARREVTAELQQAAWWDDLFALNMAEGYALIGDLDAAFLYLEHAIDYGIANEEFLSRHDHMLSRLRSDPRFDSLMVKARRMSHFIGSELQGIVGDGL